MNLKHKLITLYHAVYNLTYPIFFSIPIHVIRLVFLKLFIKQIGKQTYVGRLVDIRSPWNVCIGSNCVINKRVVLDGRGQLVIGDNVDIAQDAQIWTEQHDYNDDYHKTQRGLVVINDYAWISSRTSILPGVIIGRGSVVASGAVVTKNVDDMSVVGGIPAKVIAIRTSKLKYKLAFSARYRF